MTVYQSAKHKPFLAIPCLIAALASPSALSAISQTPTEKPSGSVNAEGQFIGSSEEGWFWYKDPVIPEEEPEVEKEKKEEKEKESPVIVMELPEPEPELEPVEEAPEVFSVKWFKERLQENLEKAIDDPTPENVRNYYVMQRIMMDKAQRFAEVAQSVVEGDKMLDETNRRPYEPSTGVLLDRKSKEALQKTFASLTNDIGVAYFYSGDEATCPTCIIAGRNIENLMTRLDVEVMAISLDGKAHPGGYLKNKIVMDQGQGERLGVDTGPSMFVMIPPDRWIPISHAAMTQVELMRRVLRVAKDEGLISESEFKMASGVQHTPSTLDALEAIKAQQPDGLLPEDPEELIKLLRNME